MSRLYTALVWALPVMANTIGMYQPHLEHVGWHRGSRLPGQVLQLQEGVSCPMNLCGTLLSIQAVML